MEQKKSDVVICVPTKNEEHSIQEMINKLRLLKIPFFIVDEHSADATEEIAKKNKVDIYQREGKGKGCGLITGIKIAKEKKNNFLVTIDCDNTYPTEMLPELLKWSKEYGMVIGVRNKQNIPRIHRLGNIIHTQLINLLFHAHLSDINSGMRVMNLKTGAFDNLNAKGFDIEAQLTIRALQHKLKIKEIVVNYQKRTGHSKIRLKDGILIAWRIIKDRFFCTI